MEKKIAIVFGTRPEIIKLASIIKYCEKNSIHFFTIHSGQHYSHVMDAVFFEQLHLPLPDYQLAIKSEAPFMQGQHTGAMMQEIEKILLREKPSDVLVQGDTNTVLAGSLVTAKIRTVKQLVDFSPLLGHIEACLRSYDKTMPEEMNRVIADHVSDLLFAPTPDAKKNALRENIDAKKIFVTGNTVVDAIKMVEQEVAESNAMQLLGLNEKQFALLTLHRQENVDVSKKLASILKGIALFARETGIKVIWTVHPRAKKMLANFGITVPKEIKAIEPLGFIEFLSLEKNSALVFTDSGGVQEEACVFGTGCVTLRENTERPETAKIGANALAGWESERIRQAAKKMLSMKKHWQQPFGNGKAGEKIMKIVLKG